MSDQIVEPQNNKADWFIELSVEQQMDILEGIAEADRGETVSHNEAVQAFAKWGLQ